MFNFKGHLWFLTMNDEERSTFILLSTAFPTCFVSCFYNIKVYKFTIYFESIISTEVHKCCNAINLNFVLSKKKKKDNEKRERHLSMSGTHRHRWGTETSCPIQRSAHPKGNHILAGVWRQNSHIFYLVRPKDSLVIKCSGLTS